ncbi:MAG: hypothetical protein ACLUD0_03435 [Eubacterium ramulus]
MQLDYKDIIIKHYALSMSGSEIARQTGFSKSGVNDFLRAFKKCEDLNFPLPAGITNYGIALKVYGSVPGAGGRNGEQKVKNEKSLITNFVIVTHAVTALKEDISLWQSLILACTKS